MADFLALCVGYSLTGSVVEEAMFFVYGPTQTGKSTFMELVMSALGDHGQWADFATFLQHSRVGGPRPDLARLAGCRMVASIEVEEGRRLNAGLIKQVVSGDTLTARFLYGRGLCAGSSPSGPRGDKAVADGDP